MIRIAKEAAFEAAKIIKANFRKITVNDIREKQSNDFLTYVDEKAEEKIIEIIQQAYPHHAILAEESGEKNKISPYQWIIDPLDGTKNFISGIPIFGISIALKFQDELLLAVVYDPMREDMFYAEKDKGSYLNKQRIQVSQQVDMSKCLFATGFPFRYRKFIPKYMVCFEDLFNHFSGIRRMGSASIDLSYVAAGSFECFWEIGLKSWDIAAGSLIVSEAGGKITDFWGNKDYLDKSYTVASNNYIHAQILEIIQKHFPNYLPVE